MEEQFDNRYKWTQAASKGLVLAAATIVLTIPTNLNIGTVPNVVLEIVRTVACIWLLVRFMKGYLETTGQSPLGFAVATVLFSSVICAFFDAASYTWLFPEVKAQVEAAFEEAIAQVPSEGASIMENFMDAMPKWLLIVGFIKNFLIGLIAASITNSCLGSRKTIFDGDNKDEEDELA